jgi:hypothetical protein
MYEIYTSVLGTTATPLPGNRILTNPDVPGADVETAVRTSDELKASTVTVALQGKKTVSNQPACDTRTHYLALINSKRTPSRQPGTDVLKYRPSRGGEASWPIVAFGASRKPLHVATASNEQRNPHKHFKPTYEARWELLQCTVRSIRFSAALCHSPVVPVVVITVVVVLVVVGGCVVGCNGSKQ